MSKINDLLQNLGNPIDSYREWEVPKNYPFPVYRKSKGSLIYVYKLNHHVEKIDDEDKHKQMVDSYFKEEIVKSKGKNAFTSGAYVKK